MAMPEETGTGNQSDADDIIAAVLFAAMTEREHAMLEGPDDMFTEYRAISAYLSLHFLDEKRRLNRECLASADIPF